MDFIWVRGRVPKTCQGYLRALPWQGERFCQVCAVSFLLRHRYWSFGDLGPGLRALGSGPRAPGPGDAVYIRPTSVAILL